MSFLPFHLPCFLPDEPDWEPAPDGVEPGGMAPDQVYPKIVKHLDGRLIIQRLRG